MVTVSVRPFMGLLVCSCARLRQGVCVPSLVLFRVRRDAMNADVKEIARQLVEVAAKLTYLASQLEKAVKQQPKGRTQ